MRRDGSMVPVGYASAPFATDEGNGAVVVFRDITSQLESEEAHARAAAEQARAEEIAASRARIVAAAAEERRRIGRDLHDGAQQRLVHALMRSRRPPAPRRPRRWTPRADELRRAVRDLRELAAGIHPAVLTDAGLRRRDRGPDGGRDAAGRALAGRRPLPRRHRGRRLLRRRRGAGQRGQARPGDGRARRRRRRRTRSSSRSPTTAAAAPTRCAAAACAASRTASPPSAARCGSTAASARRCARRSRSAGQHPHLHLLTDVPDRDGQQVGAGLEPLAVAPARGQPDRVLARLDRRAAGG